MKTIILALLLAMAGTATWAQMISDNEKNAIVQLREEEKLARDFNLVMNEQWNNKVFANISDAEVYHMSQMELLVQKYKLDDPVAANNDARGVFSNDALQKAYDEMVPSGKASLVAAFKAGAKIEEMDIRDLKAALSISSSKEATGTYNYLLQASSNHLNAYVWNLKKAGITYIPVILSQDEYNAIIANKTPGKGMIN